LKVAIVGDYASINTRIGTELSKRDYQVDYFLQENKYADLPVEYTKLGSVQGSVYMNYLRTGYWRLFGKILKNADIQFIGGTYPKIVRAKNTCYYYVGSDLRMGTTKPHYPSFVTYKELLDYSKGSVFLPRPVDPKMFYPMADVKEKKEKYKDDNGIDYVIGHFAHSPHIKGSDVFQQAIDNIIQDEGLNIEFLNHPVPREKMLETYNSCDYVLDHVNPKTGKTYNVVTLESLYCEVPAATYYEDDYFDIEEMKKYIGFIDSEPGKTEETILDFIKKKQVINREDIMKFHSPEVVVDILESFWTEWDFIPK